MINVLSKIKRLRGPDEVRVRARQALHALAERMGWSGIAKMPSDEKLFGLFQSELRISSRAEVLDHFRLGSHAKVFPSFSDRADTVAALRRDFPNAELEILSRAERLVSGSFDLLGLKDLSFGKNIDWHFEPLTGERLPNVHWSSLGQLAAKHGEDKKIIWELNRHQYFITLGQAYWLSGDEGYAETFVSHLQSWMEANPPKVGINWSSSLEVAYRSISWLWAFGFFQHSKSLSAEIFTCALKFLYLNARHIETYLSTYFSPNTHLTGEALGLFYLGSLLPEFREANRWRETGKNILLEQLPIHVKADGVYFEQSTYYHRYTADIYTHFVILSRFNNVSLPAWVESKVKALLDYLMFITRPDGTTPFFGDDDGGRLLSFHPRPTNDFRATLSNGAALFCRSDYKFVARGSSEETLWLLGPDALRSLDEIEQSQPQRESVAFGKGGYYVMRDSWNPDANYLLFDCGPHGTDNCGHAHADALSLELAVAGRTTLVDPGTFTYTGSHELRDWFRSSLAHNTLTIDDRSSSEPAGPFSWQSIATCALNNWISRERFDYVAGQHNGYQRLPDPVAHDRSILFLKHDYWVMRDRVRSESEHRADVWFHFEPAANPLIQTSDSQVSFAGEREGDAGLDIYCFGNGQWRRKEAWVSHCYAERAAARAYAFSTRIMGNDEIVTFLLPQQLEKTWQVIEIEALGGRAFEVAHENGLDIVMIRTAERVETARLASNFEWTWVRFSRDSSKLPEEFVILSGQDLELEGRKILRSARFINYLTASRQGDQFRVESDEGVLDLSLSLSDLDSWFAGSKRQART